MGHLLVLVWFVLSVNMGVEEHVKDWDATCMGAAGWVPVHVRIKSIQIRGTCSSAAAAAHGDGASLSLCFLPGETTRCTARMKNSFHSFLCRWCPRPR